MNSAYQIIDDKVVVTSDLGFKTTREISNNFEEILITENNIEEINELIKKEKYSIPKRSTSETVAPAWFGFATSQFILSIPKFIANDIGSAIIHILSSICFFSAAYFSAIKPAIKRKKIKDKKIEVLTQKLEEEKEKLSELKEDNTNDLMCVNQDFKMLSRSIKMKMLKDRLTDINLYLKSAIELGTASAACSLSKPGSTEGMRPEKEVRELYAKMR